MKKLLLILPLLILLGCVSKRLESGGAYAPAVTNITTGEVTAVSAPDLGFFAIDSAFDLAYSIIDAAFAYERNNRIMLWNLSPEIKHALDRIRPQAVAAKRRYALARQAYKANPIPANLGAMQTALSGVQSVSVAASAAFPQPKPL